jgi:hypothetical protein
MGENEFTPGPWKVGGFPNYRIGDRPCRFVCVGDNESAETPIRIICRLDEDNPNIDADAYLIKAAPKLFAALVALYASDNPTEEILDQALDALNEARGEP